MGSIDLQEALSRAKGEVDHALAGFLAEEEGIPERLRQAMAHSLLGGGKRLRPILVLWTWQALMAGDSADVPAPPADVLRAACGLECLHTYSLIHDDLPAMDDDVLRRGRPTCHVAFDEATAILAGDGLQALGFNWLARAAGGRAAEVVAEAAAAVGPAGMVGGQQLDLDAEGSRVGPDEVTRIHRLKTGALITVSLLAGARLAGAKASSLATLERAGQALGLAFQGADDLLDLEGDAGSLGKTPGKDQAAGKATWIRALGADEARQITTEYGRTGCGILVEVLPSNPAAGLLQALAAFLWQRAA